MKILSLSLSVSNFFLIYLHHWPEENNPNMSDGNMFRKYYIIQSVVSEFACPRAVCWFYKSIFQDRNCSGSLLSLPVLEDSFQETIPRMANCSKTWRVLGKAGIWHIASPKSTKPHISFLLPPEITRRGHCTLYCPAISLVHLRNTVIKEPREKSLRLETRVLYHKNAGFPLFFLTDHLMFSLKKKTRKKYIHFCRND